MLIWSIFNDYNNLNILALSGEIYMLSPKIAFKTDYILEGKKQAMGEKIPYLISGVAMAE